MANPTVTRTTSQGAKGSQFAPLDPVNLPSADAATPGGTFAGTGQVVVETVGGGTGADPNNATITLEIQGVSDSFTVNQADNETLEFDLTAAINSAISAYLAANPNDGKFLSSIAFVEQTDAMGDGTQIYDATLSFNDGSTTTVADALDLSNIMASGGGGGSGLTESQVNALIATAIGNINYTPYEDINSITLTNSGISGVTDLVQTVTDNGRSVTFDIDSLIPDSLSEAITGVNAGTNITVDSTTTNPTISSHLTLEGNPNTATITGGTAVGSTAVNTATLVIHQNTGLALVDLGNGRYVLAQSGSTPVVPTNPVETSTITGGGNFVTSVASDIVLTVTSDETLLPGSASYTHTAPDGTEEETTLTTGASNGNTVTYTVDANDADEPGTYTISATPTDADGTSLDTVTESATVDLPYWFVRGSFPSSTTELSNLGTPSGNNAVASTAFNVPVGTGILYLVIAQSVIPNTVTRVVYTNGVAVTTRVQVEAPRIEVTHGDATETYIAIRFAGQPSGGTMTNFT